MKRILLDTTFLLPFFGLDLGEINSILENIYENSEGLYFAEISLYEALFKLFSLYRREKITDEIINNFWKNFEILTTDRKIKFVKPSNKIISTMNMLEKKLSAKLNIIDMLIVASAIDIRSLLTVDRAILRSREEIKKITGIVVYSPSTLKC